MKYFTVEWWRGQQDGDEDEPVRAYAERLQSVRHLLPSAVERLEQEIPLHDSRLRTLQVDIDTGTATLSLDLADGRRISLAYTGLKSFRAAGDPKQGLSGPFGFGDFGYDEFDVLPEGDFEHRILFSSGIEIALVFRDLAIA